MTHDEIIKVAHKAGLHIATDVNWMPIIGLEYAEKFAKLIAQHERDRICAEQLELPEPRLTDKFSITAGKFKCTGCTGTWTDRDDAKHHLCKDYQ